MRLQLFFFLLLGCSLIAQSTASRQVTKFDLADPATGISRTIWVWLPKAYKTSAKNYPVLYMHDAQNLFDAKTSFAGEWNVDETLEQLNAEVVAVGIEHGNEKRIDELTPFAHPKHGGGRADAYLNFIVNTLKPKIDSQFRTNSDAANTGIMGSSLGGLVSFYALLKYPDVFGKAGVFSPSFWFSDEIYAYAEKTPSLKSKKIYFLCGDKEDETMAVNMQRIASEIEKHNVNAVQHVIPAGEHNEKLWRENFGLAFTWLFED